MIALSEGRPSDNPNTHFEGQRPVTMLFTEKLTPRSLGAIISFYENRTMFLGFLWDINSFDQEGVTLGKIVASQLLKGEGSSSQQEIFKSILPITNASMPE